VIVGHILRELTYVGEKILTKEYQTRTMRGWVGVDDAVTRNSSGLFTIGTHPVRWYEGYCYCNTGVCAGTTVVLGLVSALTTSLTRCRLGSNGLWLSEAIAAAPFLPPSSSQNTRHFNIIAKPVTTLCYGPSCIMDPRKHHCMHFIGVPYVLRPLQISVPTSVNSVTGH
jgi:hypothetical protein